MDKIKSYQPVTSERLNVIANIIGPMQAAILRLGEVDLSKGAGIINEHTECLWTKKGRRITFSMEGGFVGSVSRELDPDCPDSTLQNEI